MTREKFYNSLEESNRPQGINAIHYDLPKGIYEYAEYLFEGSLLNTGGYIEITPLTPDGEQIRQNYIKHYPIGYKEYNFKFNDELYNLILYGEYY